MDRFVVGCEYRITTQGETVDAVCIAVHRDWMPADDPASILRDMAFVAGDHRYDEPLGLFVAKSNCDVIFNPRTDGPLKVGQVFATTFNPLSGPFGEKTTVELRNVPSGYSSYNMTAARKALAKKEEKERAKKEVANLCEELASAKARLEMLESGKGY